MKDKIEIDVTPLKEVVEEIMKRYKPKKVIIWLSDPLGYFSTIEIEEPEKRLIDVDLEKKIYDLWKQIHPALIPEILAKLLEERGVEVDYCI